MGILLFERSAGARKEYEQPEYYIVDDGHFHVNAGAKQYSFNTDEIHETAYEQDLSGHWKHDRIHLYESFTVPSKETLDSIRLCLGLPIHSAF